MKYDFILAIDGPAGSGKSTVAKLVAQKLGMNYLDTGAMYRALTLACIRKKIDFTDQSEICKVAESMDLSVSYSGGKLKVYLGTENVSEAIRKPAVNENISTVSEISKVRTIMVKKQREITKGGVVVEGRDIQTVVFPDAKYKFYLDADFDVRVKRRYKEMAEKNFDITEEDVAADLNTRDTSDRNRACGPLKQAKEAVYIDTSNMSVEDVVKRIVYHVEGKGASK